MVTSGMFATAPDVLEYRADQHQEVLGERLEAVHALKVRPVSTAAAKP